MVSGAGASRNTILAILFIGMLMSALDIAILGPALPALIRQFSLTERSAAWLYTSYILCFLIGTPFMAALSDRRGRRPVYIAAVALFGAGSLLFAVSFDFSLLLVSRAVQGFGAGGIMPVANAVVGDMFPVEKRGMALGILQAVFGIALILGPVLGGLLLMVNWRFLFLVNIPIALAVIVLSARSLSPAARADPGPLDWQGLAMLVPALFALSFGISSIDSRRLAESVVSGEVLPFLAAAAVLLPAFVLRELKAPRPVLPVRLLCSGQVARGSVVSALTGFCIAGIVFMPSMAMQYLGVGQSAASFIMLPMVLSTTVASVIAGKMLEWVSARSEMLAGALMMAAGMFAIAQSARSAPLFVAAEIVFGAGLAAVPIRFVMLSAVPSSHRTVTQGLLSMNMSIGQMVGGVLLGAVIASYGDRAAGYRDGYLALCALAALMVLVSLGFAGGRTKDVEGPPCGEGKQSWEG